MIKPRDISLPTVLFISIYDYFCRTDFFQCNAQFKYSWHVLLGHFSERLLGAMFE